MDSLAADAAGFFMDLIFESVDGTEATRSAASPSGIPVKGTCPASREYRLRELFLDCRHMPAAGLHASGSNEGESSLALSQDSTTVELPNSQKKGLEGSTEPSKTAAPAGTAADNQPVAVHASTALESSNADVLGSPVVPQSEAPVKPPLPPPPPPLKGRKPPPPPGKSQRSPGQDLAGTTTGEIQSTLCVKRAV